GNGTDEHAVETAMARLRTALGAPRPPPRPVTGDGGGTGEFRGSAAAGPCRCRRPGGGARSGRPRG
ncbi:hypothetical protein ACWCTD_15445, partial [Streptomyces sp. NPDC001499]